MNEKEKLQAYSEKRDFRRTPEPGGETRPGHKEPVFVIQKHDARNLHYDLRLEANGVLKSWAVPKGPSTDPAVKRLAVATEDHPLEYAEFEGSIPEGDYGAGEVIVWDTGTYRNTTKKNGKNLSVEDAIEHGYLTVWLEGKKLRGGYALNRFRRDKQEQWLLVKLKDEAADPQSDPVSTQPESVLTSRTIEQIREGEKERKNRSPLEQASITAKDLAKKTQGDKGDHRMPSHIDPMLALLAKAPRHSEDYAFEYKWDGIRAICYWDGQKMRLEGRNERDITYRWPELEKLGEVLNSVSAILDGEIVALDTKGRVSFSLLAKRMHLSSKPSAAQMRQAPIVYMIFDVVYLKDRLLTGLPYRDRRAILDEMKLSDEKWQTPPSYTENPKAMLAAATQNGLEGVVAKKLDSHYLPGSRTKEWLKIKPINRQEFVIGGWTAEKGARERGVGALLIGYYDSSKRLVFAGKVGTGFTREDRLDLKELFDAIARKTDPFTKTEETPKAFFVKPVMVAEIEFREWTPDGRLRHPSFKGLRDDKNPREIVREIPDSGEN